MVLGKGLEPLRLTAHAPQTCVSTNSTTRAIPNREGALRAITQTLSSPEIFLRCQVSSFKYQEYVRSDSCYLSLDT